MELKRGGLSNSNDKAGLAPPMGNAIPVDSINADSTLVTSDLDVWMGR